MTIQDITSWLKDSVPGIILLGAIGSLLAVVIGHILKPVVLRIIPEPIKQHRKRMTKQAFMLGFSAAIIEDDETGKYLVAFLIFHLCKIVLCVGFVLASVVIFSVAISLQSEVALTATTFSAVFCAFLGLYWTYIEYEYVNRTYLFFWKRNFEMAEARFIKSRASVEGQNKEI